jgi:hypothetical protein
VEAGSNTETEKWQIFQDMRHADKVAQTLL